MTDLLRAYRVVPGAGTGADDHVSLDYEGRFLRRRRLQSAGGRAFLVDLPEVTSLDDGDALELEDGTAIAVRAAPEALLEIAGENLPRLAWHIGNRHTPCRIEADRLLIRHDHVLADMLERLGATVTAITAPFQPEGGAYGHGRTMGHDHGGHAHGHSHGDPHPHNHEPSRDHGQSHGKGPSDAYDAGQDQEARREHSRGEDHGAR